MTPSAEPGPQGIATAALERMSRAFSRRNIEALLATFSAHPSATYAGSEAGEIATGPDAMRDLLGSVLARPASYSFTFHDVRSNALAGQFSGDSVWVLADGTGYETSPNGIVEPFPYRISGVLVHERGGWRWALLAGAEPADAESD
jgi:hypothetical protein